MKPDKLVKKEFKRVVSADPDAYFATSVLRTEGFERRKCSCGTYFWSTDASRSTCDDPACSGGFRFFENNPSAGPLDYVGVWKRFGSLFTSLGYTPIPRYPVVARWRDDTDFVQASIYDFQPYVVSGEVDPPANPLVVPQFCLRFNDIDNVGLTMSHMTGFIMIGQHTFVPKEAWDQEKLFGDIYLWLRQGLGLPKEEITFHEDAWAGGGNFGPCMEFFSRGLELGNQVYMLFEQTPDGSADLPLKVLDMGMGQDRIAWFTQGTGTMYDASFPAVMSKLYERTGLVVDEMFMKKYVRVAAFLNVDEVEDSEKAWSAVAKTMNMGVPELKDILRPLTAVYSVAEHARSLLFALNDGALPSNVGGGYNLRVILRRALGFIDEFGWDLSLQEVMKWHAQDLSRLFPELSENLDDICLIVEHERQRFMESRKRNEDLVSRLVKQDSDFSTDLLLELYDSHGITPDEVVSAAKGRRVLVPENFYALVASLHEKKEQKTATRKEFTIDAGSLPATVLLYFDHYDYVSFTARVLMVQGDMVVLDRTAFYPTSGGQIHDVGTISNEEVVEVIKQSSPLGTIVLHKLAAPPTFAVGDTVACKIDAARRLQLAQHHSATHVLTGSARRILGNHIWQAGAAKTMTKSRLDITHFAALREEQVQAIEDLANSIVEENRPILKRFVPRDIAEKQYGFRLYQGGAVPGKSLRIVEIPGFDVEACGGTHLDVTGDIGRISIVRSSKISDGVVRLEFVAGAAQQEQDGSDQSVLDEALKVLGGSVSTLPARAQLLFSAWKSAKKKTLVALDLSTSEESTGDLLAQMARILKTQPEHVVKTLVRFKSDIDHYLDEK